jgi:hypothetical protein
MKIASLLSNRKMHRSLARCKESKERRAELSRAASHRDEKNMTSLLRGRNRLHLREAHAVQQQKKAWEKYFLEGAVEYFSSIGQVPTIKALSVAFIIRPPYCLATVFERSF